MHAVYEMRRNSEINALSAGRFVGVSAPRLSAVRAATHSLTERRAVRNPSLIIASCDLPSAMVPLLNALLAFAQSAEPFVL